jgi:hypothetical protein
MSDYFFKNAKITISQLPLGATTVRDKQKFDHFREDNIAVR